jgi:hypothetical protein
MSAFVYRCPATGLNVQGFTADDPTEDETYESVSCTACLQVHMVNPKTGKVLGSQDLGKPRS